MKLMILGLGVIGTTYGYVFKKAGHEVDHFIRETKRHEINKDIHVELFDGRYDNKGENKKDIYEITIAKENSFYDFILVSVSSGKLENAIKTLNEKNIFGTIILFNGIWETRSEIDKIMVGRKYILGYPVAGGNIYGKFLECVLFDHIMIERKEKANIDNYQDLMTLIESANIKGEKPFDMLEWIWIHMAINAGVIDTAAKYGDIKDTTEAARNLMNDSHALSEAVCTIRECVKVVKIRGVKLKHYMNEIVPYKIPSKLAGVIMKNMFKKNELTRRIMELHSNENDLIYVCESVYSEGINLKVNMPLFKEKYEEYIEELKNR